MLETERDQMERSEVETDLHVKLISNCTFAVSFLLIPCKEDLVSRARVGFGDGVCLLQPSFELFDFIRYGVFVYLR